MNEEKEGSLFKWAELVAPEAMQHYRNMLDELLERKRIEKEGTAKSVSLFRITK